jgi:hypothetical protein
MTTDEIEILNATRDVWNKFIELPVLHPSDQGEFCQHIHALQNIILAREGVRKLNEINP